MKKIWVVSLVSIYIGVFLSGFALAQINKNDDLQRSFKDLQRSIKQDSLKGGAYQSPQQTLPQGLVPSPQQKFKPFAQDAISQDKPVHAQAVIRNLERLKELKDKQRRQSSTNSEDWEAKIPEKYRFMIELVVVALFITFFGLAFYKRKVKKREASKEFDDDGDLGDGINFFNVD
ncbi:hypothetical protein ACFL2J_03605 [Candidatus Omnitrophota bacterium]